MNAPRVPAGRLRIGLAVAAALLASACAAGQQAQTADEKPTLDGTNADVGAIALRAIAIEAPTQASYEPGDNAPLRIVLVNNGSKPDALTSIKTSAAGGWASYNGPAPSTTTSTAPASTSTSASPVGTKASHKVTIAPASRVSFAMPESKMSLVLTGVTQKLYPGEAVKVTFSFANAGAVTVDVPVALSETPPMQSVPATRPGVG